MERFYTLKTGKRIRTWFNELGWVVIRSDDGRSELKTIGFDIKDPDPQIEIDGETIHLNDFDYTPADLLVRKVNSGKFLGTKVSEEEAIPTLMKEGDKVGFVMKLVIRTPDMMSGEHVQPDTVLMIPTEGKWKKCDWYHKIELIPEQKELRAFIKPQTFYFSDLWTQVQNGSAKIVSRSFYRKLNPVDVIFG